MINLVLLGKHVLYQTEKLYYRKHVLLEIMKLIHKFAHKKNADITGSLQLLASQFSLES